MITKIRVKSKHIEFQLDGGGYGTMSDETSTSVPAEPTPKTQREKNVEAQLKNEKDPVKRRELKEELDDLRKAREREDARNRAEVADAEEPKEQNLRQRRLGGGSRFNVRYRDRLPDAVLTPEGLRPRWPNSSRSPPPPPTVRWRSGSNGGGAGESAAPARGPSAQGNAGEGSGGAAGPAGRNQGAHGGKPHGGDPDLSRGVARVREDVLFVR